MKDSFVQIEGNRFVLADGPVRLKGSNYISVRLKGTNYQGPTNPFNTFTHWAGDEVVASHIGLCADLGMNVVRVGVPWGEKGERLPLILRFLELCRERGLRLYPALCYPRRFAPAGTLEDALNKVYLRELVGTLAGEPGIVAWDLGNELDHIDHERWQWGMDLDEAARRLDFIRRMAEEIRRLDGRHPVSMGSTFSYSYWIPEKPFPLLEVVDFVDFHYYRRNYRTSTLAEEVAAVRERTDKPILLGEIGRSSDPNFHTAGEEENDEEIQADSYRRYIADVAASDAVGFLQWTLFDYVMYEEAESFYGIHRVDGTPKPAAEVVRTAYQAYPGPGEW